MILTRAGQILDRFAEIAAVQLGTAFPRGANQRNGKTRFEGHRNERRLAEA